MASRLLSAPQEQLSEHDWANRRVALRHSCGQGTSGRILNRGNRPRRATIRDISVGGVALILRTPLKPGSRILIQFKNDDLDITYDLAAKVVHSNLKIRGKWVVGCAFLRPLSEWELKTLL